MDYCRKTDLSTRLSSRYSEIGNCPSLLKKRRDSSLFISYCFNKINFVLLNNIEFMITAGEAEERREFHSFGMKA